MDAVNAERYLSGLDSGTELTDDDFKRIYGFSYSDPDYAETVLAKLEELGCKDVRKDYERWVNAYESGREAMLKGASESYNAAGQGASKAAAADELFHRLEALNAAENYPTGDLGSARLFSEVFRNECRYSPTVRDWLYYDGARWVQDLEGMKARSNCKALADAVSGYATYSEQIDSSKKKDYLKYAYSLASGSKRNTIVNDSRDINAFTSEELDEDDYLLNLLDCTLDLRTDPPTVREHDPDDLLSKVANVTYDPAAECPLWARTVDEIMEGDKAKIRYLQKLLGLCLTGDTSREELYFFYGSTSRNGKSTITETMIYILGDYAETINPETLAVKNNKDSRSASPDLAKLAGARLVVASEPPKRMLFDSSLVKTLTGRDRITARHLYQNEQTFTPRFKLLINTNYLPTVTDPTLFLSERVKVIEFNKHFSDDEQDKQLKDKLRTESSGILNWLLDGYRMYKAEGLTPPESVRSATSDYAEESDKLGRFIDECLIKQIGGVCAAGQVYQDYAEWTEQNGCGQESKSNFFSDLKTKGIFKDTGTIDGRTVKNVIVGYTRVKDGFVDADKDLELPF